MRRVAVLVFCLTCAGSVAWADGLNVQERHRAELAFLEGNLERLAAIEPHATSPDDRFPFAVRDLYWRPDPTAHARYDAVAAQADGLVRERYRWLLSSEPRGPYPAPEVGGEPDTWPMLSALIEDRIRRESTGRAGLPEGSPVTKLAVILHKQDEVVGLDDDTRIRLEYLDHQRNDLSGVVDGFELNEQEIEDAEIARSIKERNKLLAFLVLALFVAASLGFGFVSRRRDTPVA